MKARWAAPLLVLGVARAALAGEVVPAPAPPVEPLVTLPAPAPETKADPAPIAGALTAFVPFVVGSAMWAADENRQLQNIGTYVMATGFAAAPWVAQGLHGRWKRAAAYGSISAAMSAATLIAMEVKDPFVDEVKNRERVPFGVLLTAAMFAGAIGVIDSFVVGPKGDE
jgi:hypothetical protein